MKKTVITIPATIDTATALPISGGRKRRVAAYARVSTDHEEQTQSFAVQSAYYTSYIRSRGDWEFIRIYTDEGISGTSLSRREGFKQMVRDAMEHEFDLLITKSVSRFARNTVDSLNTIRQLKAIGVECYFEKENIWTFDSKGEFLITLMSSLAQEESRSISENIRWGIRKGFESGKVIVDWKRLLGYGVDAGGSPIIIEEEAEVVREIYRMYLSGLSERAISEKLTERAIPTTTGNDVWQQIVVRSILTNEKYKGDSRLQKYFTTSYLTKKCKKNEGELPQYYVRDTHPAIVTAEVFDMAQSERQRRNCLGTRYTSGEIISSKIRCGACGCRYGRRVWHCNEKYRKIVYQCDHKYYMKDDKKSICDSPNLTESDIAKLFNNAMYNHFDWQDEVDISIDFIGEILCDKKDIIASVGHDIGQNAEKADIDLWGALVESVTACGDDDIVFRFRDGGEIKVGKG